MEVTKKKELVKLKEKKSSEIKFFFLDSDMGAQEIFPLTNGGYL